MPAYNVCENTVASALALKELPGDTYLEPVTEPELTPNDIIGENKGLKGVDKGTVDRKMGQSPPRENPSPGTVPIFPPFKPHYIAHTKIQTLALLDEEHKGSNWYVWRRR